MILIFSENNDLTTDKVIEWLTFMGIKDIIRMNEDDTINVKRIDFRDNTIIFTFKNQEINIEDIHFFWFRRGNLNHFVYGQLDFENSKIKDQVSDFLNYEWLMCRNFVFYNLQKKKSLGNFFRSATNKLINLSVAKECGLEIPETFVSEFSSELTSFQNRFPVITKPIGESMFIHHNAGYYTMLTTSVEKKTSTNNSLDYISPVLYQQKIEKQFEIRAFIMYEHIYSMAIFSQRNAKTNIDYRNYDNEQMNRMIPYILPTEIQEKILSFMQKIGLNTGSLDMIKTTDNRFVFLEINPAGNIEMVSDTCCYNIEKKIAEAIQNKIQDE